MLRKYKLTESKQVGKLYHVTTWKNLVKIMKEDVLGLRDRYVSFSRNPRYTYISGQLEGKQVQLVIDGNKLSNRYKIEQYADQGSWVEGKRFEAEERVKGQIRDIGKYIIEIRLLQDIYDVDPGELDIYFTYLSKYKHLENLLFPDKQNYHDLDNLWGIYKNGKKVKSFTEDNIAEVCFEFFKLEQYYDDEMSQGSYFGSFDPGILPFSGELDGYDLVWVFSDGIQVRCQNPNQYKYLEKIDNVRYIPYISYWEQEAENEDEEPDEDFYRL